MKIVDENSVDWSFTDAHETIFLDNTNPVIKEHSLSSGVLSLLEDSLFSDLTPEQNEEIRKYLAGYEI